MLSAAYGYNPDIQIVSGNSSEVSSHSTAYTNPGLQPMSRYSTRRSVSQGWRPEVISSFQSLSSIAILDIDSLEQVPSVRDMIKNSSSTLKNLALTLSGRLAAKARVRKSGDNNDHATVTDPMDFDDGWNAAPPLTAQQQSMVQANLNAGLPADHGLNLPGYLPASGDTPTTIAGARKEQEAVLGQLMDVEKIHEVKLDGELDKAGGPVLGSIEASFAAIDKTWNETRELISGPPNQDPGEANPVSKADEERMERLRELTVSLKRLTKELSSKVPHLHKPPPPSKSDPGALGWDNDDYVPGIHPPYVPDESLPPLPLHGPYSSSSNNHLGYWPTGVNIAKKHKKPFYPGSNPLWGSPYPFQSTSNLPKWPQYNEYVPSGALNVKPYKPKTISKPHPSVTPVGFPIQVKILPGPSSSPAENGLVLLNGSSDAGEPKDSAEHDGPGLFDKSSSAAIRSRARLEKKRDMKPEDIDMVHDPEIISADEELDEEVEVVDSDDGTIRGIDQDGKGKGKAKPAEMSLQDYIRSTAGISLESLSLYLIPLKTSVLIRAINFSTLQSITLLDVGSQKQLWTHLLHVHVHNPLKISKISTDHVTPEFLTLLSSLPVVTELYLYERSASTSKYELTVSPPWVSIRTIRRLALQKHIPNLRRLYMHSLGSSDRHWDFDHRMVSLIVSKGRNLEELGCTMEPSAVQILTQHLSSLEKLRVLVFLQVKRSRGHTSGSYGQPTSSNSEILNPIANTCAMAPKMALEYLGIHGVLYALDRYDEERPLPSTWSASSDDSSSDDDPLITLVNHVENGDSQPATKGSASPSSLTLPSSSATEHLPPLTVNGVSGKSVIHSGRQSIRPRQARVMKKASWGQVDRARWPREVRILRRDVMSASV